MANDPDLLVRYARLGKGEKNALYEIARKHGPALVFDEAIFGAHLTQVVDDRMAFAERFLGAAVRLLRSARDPNAVPFDPDMDYRMALARAYYAVHHALRALHVTFEDWDPDGHRETIAAIAKLFIKETGLVSRFSWLQPGPELPATVIEFLEERHVADYHFYDRDAERLTPVDFAIRAPEAYTMAQNIVVTVKAIIADRRAGNL